jgi:hypothetical protein
MTTGAAAAAIARTLGLKETGGLIGPTITGCNKAGYKFKTGKTTGAALFNLAARWANRDVLRLRRADCERVRRADCERVMGAVGNAKARRTR